MGGMEGAFYEMLGGVEDKVVKKKKVRRGRRTRKKK